MSIYCRQIRAYSKLAGHEIILPIASTRFWFVYGVALIIAGVDQKGSSVYVTDPSGTYVPYAAIAIGAGSEEANSFLEEKYDAQMSIEDAAVLAIAATNRKADDKSDKSYIRMAVITAKDGNMQKINEDDVKKYTAAADKFGKA